MRIVSASMLLGRALARLAHVVSLDRLVRAVRFTCRLAERSHRLTDSARPAAPATLPTPAPTPEDRACR